MSETADRLDQLFYQLLQQAPAERLAWLHAHCTDAAERAEIGSLLAAHERAGDFMQQPLQLEVESELEYDLVGRRLGPYQIENLIARGGMGRVYRAHRVDGEYQQQVAIKLIETAGIDPALIRHERQILADLHHPNIVSLIDGGTLQEGIPYLVMEYVQGQPIHQYVRHQQLSERQTVLLFCALTRIVEQIHRHGVIHCDLKPDNVLVTEQGDLKLLDFGVAHLSSTPPGEQLPVSRAVTPEYASPQRHSNPLPRVTDDIYSLGVLLGVMLSRQTPVAAPSDNGGYRIDLAAIGQRLSPELRAVFDKASGADGALRYQTVAELTADLCRWLDREPLHAMGNGRGYRLRKLVQRHWRKSASGLLMVMLTLGMALTWQVQSSRAERAQSMAVAQVDSMLRELDDQLERLSGSTPARVATVEALLKRLMAVAEQQPADKKMTRAMADAHMKLGQLLGHPFLLHLNQFARSREHYRQALTLYQQLFAGQPESFRAALRVTRAERALLTHLVFLDRRPEQALRPMQAGLDRLEQIERSSLGQNSQLAIQYLALSHLLTGLGRLEDAAAGYRRAEELLQRADDAESEYVREHNRRVRGFFEEERAAYLFARGEYRQARGEFEQILQRYQGESLWRDRRRLSRAHFVLACIDLIDRRPVAGAVDHLRQGERIIQTLVDQYPSAVSLQWELARYAPPNGTDPQTGAEWQAALDCRNAFRIMDPPLPPASPAAPLVALNLPQDEK